MQVLTGEVVSFRRLVSAKSRTVPDCLAQIAKISSHLKSRDQDAVVSSLLDNDFLRAFPSCHNACNDIALLRLDSRLYPPRFKPS
jgi:hypothetical protein